MPSFGGPYLRLIFTKKYSLKPLNQIKPKRVRDGHWVVPFQFCIRQHRPPFKIATVTKNIYFFICPLLLIYQSKWAQILKAAAWHTFQVFCDFISFRLFIPIMTIKHIFKISLLKSSL